MFARNSGNQVTCTCLEIHKKAHFESLTRGHRSSGECAAEITSPSALLRSFLTRILTRVLIQLRSDGLTEKGFALAHPVAGQKKCANEGDEVESDRFWFGPYIRRQSTLNHPQFLRK